MRKIYSVTTAMRGYLPDNEPAIFTNKRNAQGYMLSEAREYRHELGARVTGNMRDGYDIEPTSKDDCAITADVTIRMDVAYAYADSVKDPNAYTMCGACGRRLDVGEDTLYCPEWDMTICEDCL